MHLSSFQNIVIFYKIVDTEFNIVLVPRWWNTVPEISYGIDEHMINTIPISNRVRLSFNLNLTPGDHKLWITYNNKNYNDCKLDQNLDMAVEIESVSFEGMTLDRFRWTGEYYPDYPDDYPDKQYVIKSATYLGWNGRWELPFTTPIFTWIHKIENLGWLYEP
jgi:hypothetical protein